MKPHFLLVAPVLLVVSSACIIHISGDGWQGNHNLAYVHGDGGPFVSGNGIDATENRSVAEFTAIEAATFFDVKVRVGGEQGLVLHGDENVLPHVITAVKGDALLITMEKGTYKADSPTWIEITVPTLTAYALSGSGDTEIAGIDRDSFSLSLSGSGDIAAVGRADNLAVRVSGSGALELAGLEVLDATVDVTGSSSISLAATQTLSIQISGSADVRYEGRPDVTASITGSGSVKHR